MTESEMSEKLSEILQDETKVTLLLSAETQEDCRNVFLELGLEMSPEDMSAFIEATKTIYAEELKNGELTEHSLEQVAGGGIDAVSILKAVYNVCKKTIPAAYNLGKKFANLGW